MSQEQPQKRLKVPARFIEEDFPGKRSHGYNLINSGEIRTVRLGKRCYVDMVAWRRQEAGLPPLVAE